MINQLAETKKETMPPAPRRFYLTKPTQFQIEYSINKWMDPKVQVDLPKAQQQWDALLKTYKELGAEVEVFEPLEGWPDSVFTGDSIFLYGKHAIAVYWNGRVIAGYGVRSDREALDFMAKTLSVEVVPLRLRAPHFHVDTTICPLNDSTLAYVPTALDEDGQKAVKALNANLIHINNEEARLLACNSMSVAGNVVLSTVHAPKFHAALEKAGFEVRPLDLSEFAKSGGGAKCLTLEAYNPT
jgi:N-dimethylarginine dimethylaminohydrolase